MLKLINAHKSHANQILQYYSETCYWKEFVEGNLQNKSYEDFMLEWIIIPRIPFIKVLIQDNDETKLYGVVTTATMGKFAEMPDYTPYLNPKVMEVFGAWFNFPVATNCVVLELYALSKEIRGKGYSKILLDYVDSIYKENNASCTSCFVWDCFPESIIATTRYGYRIVDVIHFPKPIKFNLLYMEKTPEFTFTQNYFQSLEYKNTTNLLVEKS